MNSRLLVVLLLIVSSTSLWGESGSVVHVDDLLKPSVILKNIRCAPSEGLHFERSKGGKYSISGQLSGELSTLVLRPDSGVWDMSAYCYLRVDIVNTGAGLVWIQGRLDNPGAKDWHNSTASMVYIMPGERGTLGFAYPRSDEANDAPSIFDSQSGKPNGHRSHWKPFDPEQVIACNLTIQSTSGEISLDPVPSEPSTAVWCGCECDSDGATVSGCVWSSQAT